jgi:hypothetical protein
MSHLNASTEKVAMPPNHNEYVANRANIDEKAPSDTDDAGVGTFTTRPNFDHVDEKKVLWKVSCSHSTDPGLVD